MYVYPQSGIVGGFFSDRTFAPCCNTGRRNPLWWEGGDHFLLPQRRNIRKYNRTKRRPLYMGAGHSHLCTLSNTTRGKPNRDSRRHLPLCGVVPPSLYSMGPADSDYRDKFSHLESGTSSARAFSSTPAFFRASAYCAPILLLRYFLF